VKLFGIKKGLKKSATEGHDIRKGKGRGDLGSIGKGSVIGAKFSKLLKGSIRSGMKKEKCKMNVKTLRLVYT